MQIANLKFNLQFAICNAHAFSRLFVAIDLTEEARAAIAVEQKRLAARLGGARCASSALSSSI